MRYTDAQPVLLECFLELLPQYQALQKEWGGDPIPNHVVFGDIFAPYLVNLSLKLDEGNNFEKLVLGMSFVEDMLNNQDFEVRALAETSVLEHLLDHQEAFIRVKPLLGSLTSDRAERIWKRWKSIP